MNRRQYLWQSGGGLGGIALTSMLGLDRLEGVGPGPILGQPHHPAKAKRVVQLFMAGLSLMENLERCSGKRFLS